jgi:hypothetical protein
VSRALPRGGKEGFLLPYNANPERLERTAIAMADMERIGDRLAAKHILFVIDACHSGFAMKRTPPSEQLLLMAENRVVQIMTAGLSGEIAVENKGNGIITAKFLEGLQGAADNNRDGIVSFYELYGFVYNKVVEASSGRQHPVLSTFAGEGDFLFLRPGTPVTPPSLAETTSPPRTVEPSRGPVPQPSLPQRDLAPRSTEKPSISPGEVRSGTLTKETTHEYTFVGLANTPVLFTVEPSKEGRHLSERLWYQVTILRAGLNVRRPQDKCCAHRAELDFTAKVDGEYTMQLKGMKNSGSYKLMMQRLE